MSRVRLRLSDRWGGVSRPPYASLNLGLHVGDDPDAVVENRARFAASIGTRPEWIAWMGQVHGPEVAVVDRPGTFAGVDGMVTDRPGVTLAVLVADCVPVLLADEQAGVVGVAHAGRRGVACGVVPATVATMVGRGAAPGRIRAAVGPAVCAACYEVPTAMADEVAALVPRTRATSRTGTDALDLPAGVAGQLAAVGVGEVTVSSRCTAEDDDLFSHRRDGPATGRFAGAVVLA